jgi:hypothetical protein
VADLQKALYKARPKLYPARQRFTLPKREGEKRAVALAPAKRLADYDLADGAELTFKDLGPQVPLNFGILVLCLFVFCWGAVCCHQCATCASVGRTRSTAGVPASSTALLQRLCTRPGRQQPGNATELVPVQAVLCAAPALLQLEQTSWPASAGAERVAGGGRSGTRPCSSGSTLGRW